MEKIIAKAIFLLKATVNYHAMYFMLGIFHHLCALCINQQCFGDVWTWIASKVQI